MQLTFCDRCHREKVEDENDWARITLTYQTANKEWDHSNDLCRSCFAAVWAGYGSLINYYVFNPKKLAAQRNSNG